MKFLNTHLSNEDIMLCNIIYHKGGGHNGYKDAIDIIYKNVNTGEKILQTIDTPEVEIYFTKEEFRNYNYTKAFMPLEMVEKKTVKYKDIIFYIAKQLGDQTQNFVKNAIANRNFAATKNIHKHPYVLGSDIDIEAWYRIQWMLNYHSEDTKKPITKMYLDIEVDVSTVTGFPKDGECAVNATTIVDEETRTGYILLLRKTNSEAERGIPDFEANVDKFVDKLHAEFDESYGDFEYKILMYDDEKELIKSIFKIVNFHKRDFCMIWNFDFDIPYLIARMNKIGLDPAEVMCHPDFKHKEAFFVKDTRNFSIPNRGSYFKCSSYTQYLDQMVLYAALRKAGSELKSYKLGAISKKEIKDEKLDYAEEGNFRDLAVANYEKFVMYSIKDTLLQFGIERKVKDLDNLYIRTLLNVVPYTQAFKQTRFLSYRAYLEYLHQGFIIGNNRNITYGVETKRDDEVKFSGALISPNTRAQYLVISI